VTNAIGCAAIASARVQDPARYSRYVAFYGPAIFASAWDAEVKGERPGRGLAWRDWHRRDARPCYRRAGLLGRLFRRQATVPMNTEEPSARDFPGSIGDQPDKRRRHHLRLDHLGAIEARVGHHRRVRCPAGNQNIDADAGAVEIRRAPYRLVWRPQIHCRRGRRYPEIGRGDHK